MNRKILIIILTILILLVIFFFPKKIDSGGGYMKAIESYYNEKSFCFGFEYHYQPDCLDCGYTDFCLGIPYGKECTESIFNNNTKEIETKLVSCNK